jgi:hypothetical protein
MKKALWLLALGLLTLAAGCEAETTTAAGPAGGCIDSFECSAGFYCSADVFVPGSRGECLPLDDTPEGECAVDDDCRRGMVCQRNACVPETVEERPDPVPDPQDDFEEVEPEPEPEPDPEPDDGACVGPADCAPSEECCEGACVARGQCADNQPDPEPEDGVCAGPADCEVFEECCEGACVQRGQCASNQPDPDPTPNGDASRCTEGCRKLVTCTGLFGCGWLIDEAACRSECQRDPGLVSAWNADPFCDAVLADTCSDSTFQLLCVLGCPAPTNIGEPCANNRDCNAGDPLSGPSSLCLRERDRDTDEETGWTGGYCVGLGCTSPDEFFATPCPGGSTCVRAGSDTFCLDDCASSGECREGYTCRPLTNGGVCVPRCQDDADCGSDACDPDSGLCQ